MSRVKQQVIIKNNNENFSGSLMVKALHFQCRGCQFNSWSGNEDLTCHRVWPKKKKKEEKTPVIMANTHST